MRARFVRVTLNSLKAVGGLGEGATFPQLFCIIYILSIFIVYFIILKKARFFVGFL